MRLTWLGHSTVVIDVADTRLVTDPVLRDRVVHLRRDGPSARTPTDVDAVLLSHGHRDHLDLPSLRALDAPVIAPPTCRRPLRRHVVRALRPGEAVDFGDVSVTAVPAVHDGRRWHMGPRRDWDAIGFVIAGEGMRTYFAGDTGVFAEMAKFRPLDLALVPISGWGPRLPPGHMGPDEAADAIATLSPRIAVPIHWGTFRRRAAKPPARDPAIAFKQAALSTAPTVRVEILLPGESLVVKALEPRP